MKKTWVGLVTSLILMTAEIVLAQTTWKGLKFGMSEADLRKDYTGSVEKLPADAEDSYLWTRIRRWIVGLRKRTSCLTHMASFLKSD